MSFSNYFAFFKEPIRNFLVFIRLGRDSADLSSLSVSLSSFLLSGSVSQNLREGKSKGWLE
jgi:hypothetical protein